MTTVSIADRAPWLRDEALQRLLAALCEGGEEARIAGGAVRNALFGEQATDVDIATTVLPDETERRAEAAGFRTVPTGKDHGTITVIADGVTYEVTTLRADVETDGRHAQVVFGREWDRDAQRRDFTINGLYAMANGEVVDLVGGLADIETRTLRFIGDAEQRIREDYLRILRFFRFFAWYGSGRPDADGIRASARLKDGLGRLSAERVWAELKKLLSAPDPSRALLWMRQAGVLTIVLPESEKWGIDAIHGLVSAERDLGWPADNLLRLAALVPPDPERIEAMAARLKMSRAETERLIAWASCGAIHPGAGEAAFSKKLYRESGRGAEDVLRLALASARARAAQDDQAMLQAAGFARLLRFAETWEKPVFPLKGADLVALGAPQDKHLGEVLRSLEDEWLSMAFKIDRDALLKRAATLLKLG